MSATAGSTFTNPTTGGLSGLGGIGTPSTVGEQIPEWDFPQGENAVPELVRTWFLRGDNGPSRLNEFLQQAPAEAIDKFRSAINSGLMRPKNEAASNISRGYGGLRAGDQTLLGPLIDGMPEGLTPEYWAVVINKAQQAANEQIALMDRTGYFAGMPTMQRQEMEAQISDNIARTEIARRLADNTIRETDLNEAFRRDEMAQQMRQNIIAQFGYDPGPQGAAGAAAGNAQASIADGQGVLPIPGSQGPGTGPSGPGQAQSPNMTMAMGEQVGWQYVPGSGWQRTVAGQAQDLAQQNQAFGQASEVAKAASNPRDYIYAQMLGNARGGLAGMPATNQLAQTTQTPGTWQQYAAQQGAPQALLGQQAQPGQPGQLPAPQPGQPGMDGQAPQAAQGMLPGQAALGSPQAGTTPQAQTSMALNQQGFQAPGVAGAGAAGVSGQPISGTANNGMPQLPGAPQGTPQPTAPGQIAVSAFTTALNKNRLVPGSGAIQGQGTWSSIADIQKNTNPLKWRTQDYMRGNFSEQQGANAVASQAGYSDEDLQSMLKKNLPTFKAPGAGAMI
jgi:hypothetical protein